MAAVSICALDADVDHPGPLAHHAHIGGQGDGRRHPHGLRQRADDALLRPHCPPISIDARNRRARPRRPPSRCCQQRGRRRARCGLLGVDASCSSVTSPPARESVRLLPARRSARRRYIQRIICGRRDETAAPGPESARSRTWTRPNAAPSGPPRCACAPNKKAASMMPNGIVLRHQGDGDAVQAVAAREEDRQAVLTGPASPPRPPALPARRTSPSPARYCARR